IIMDNNINDNSPYTINVPASNKKATKNPSVTMPIDINKNDNKSIPNPFIVPGIKKINIQSQLIDTLSFKNFIAGECNRLARSAGVAVAENPGRTSFNPLFIYGGTGLGKTHLIQAIGLNIKENFPDKTVLYIPSEQFCYQYVDAIRNQNHADFIHFYQMIDVLLIDDIHNLAGKEKTQDNFFQIFNHLHQKGKQIVITSDKPPVELKGIEARLLSRFKWGLAADLMPPDLETRKAILKNKMYNDGIVIPGNVIEYVASCIDSNIRELEGAYISIVAHSSLDKKEITLDLAKQVINKFIVNTSKEISIDFIQKIICEFFNITIDNISSKSRKREVVQARQLAMYFSKKLTKSSLTNIGLHCGNKDHATVLHSCRAVSNLIETNKQFKSFVTEIEKRIII
ncbi:MAG: chromosomal replication initiator protein DnaA, partial [Bacteroidales bacterium]|nr:chromosomal replication initiator protein DnaA [Bacteroidales bacterium]